MKYVSLLIGVGAVLAAATGCDVHFNSSTGSWMSGDLKSVTNSVQTASIPASLKDLAVENANGNVRVMGAENGVAGWTWKLSVRARTDLAAQQIARSVNCKAELAGGHLRLVVTVPDTTEPHSIQSDFEITLPKAASVRTETHFGRTDIFGLNADADILGQNGEVTLRNVTGKIHARTSFASLTVNDTGPAVLQDQNGEIEANHIAGPLEAETSFASMLAQDIHGPALLTDQNGEIRAIAVHGSLKAKTSFASIAVRDIGGPVHLRDQNGSVEAEQIKGGADIKTSFDGLSVEGIEGDAVLANQNGGVFANGVTGAVHAQTSFATMEIKGPGAEFICDNQNGSIRLNATAATVRKVEASTSFDTLELRLPAAAKPAILAETTFGGVESDFPVLKSHDADVFADVAPGVLRASLHNQNGNIRVVRD